MTKIQSKLNGHGKMLQLKLSWVTTRCMKRLKRDSELRDDYWQGRRVGSRGMEVFLSHLSASMMTTLSPLAMFLKYVVLYLESETGKRAWIRSPKTSWGWETAPSNQSRATEFWTLLSNLHMLWFVRNPKQEWSSTFMFPKNVDSV